MSKPVNLSEVPQKFLDPRAWATLRSFAPNDLLALTYINAPCPDDEDPNNFFWDRPRSASDALSCYKIGRSLLQECRARLNSGKLVATGRATSGKREVIPASEWVNLWPMFATNRATGLDRVYEEVQICKAASLETPHDGCLQNVSLGSKSVKVQAHLRRSSSFSKTRNGGLALD